jgi:4'-phosphopantetheinyl transferase
VVDAPRDLRFNLSHSGDRALLAVAIGREVGVDVEAQAPVDALALAAHAFSANERAALAATPAEDRLAAFYRGWTRKESFVKALGCGLSFPLREFDVSLEASGEPLLRACRRDAGVIGRWSILPIPADPGYCAALTVERRRNAVRLVCMEACHESR